MSQLPHMNQTSVDIKNIVKAFGAQKVVAGISLQIKKGEIFGLLGPNGAGKTTTIRMICGLLAPDAGDITINGQSVTPGDFAVMRTVGVCTQHNILWEKLTCLEQLVFLGRMYRLRQPLARKRAGLSVGLPGVER